MKISGWGNYPRIRSQITQVKSVSQLKASLANATSVIPRGAGRSYGDSSLNTHVISTLFLNRVLAFDESRGILKCESGITLERILDIIILRGWFLSVTPGTKFITLGGAIASDVHGKNHHKEGSFCDYIISMDIMLVGNRFQAIS